MTSRVRSVSVLVFILCCQIGVGLLAVGETTSSDSLSFEEAGSYGLSATFQIALGDLDGDGDLDAVFSNMNTRSEIWINDGRARFSKSYANIGGESHGAVIADFDGDGDLDLVATRASESSPTQVYLNNGNGQFTPGEALDDQSIVANAIAAFDLEGDGDLDLGIYYFVGQRHCRIYLNDGSGRFHATDTRLPGLAAWGDIDGDGDVDAVCLQHGQTGGGYSVFTNLGEDGFEETQRIHAPSAFFPGSILLGDIDGDSDLDAVSGGAFESNTPVIVLRNDGVGVFELIDDSPFNAQSGRLALADFDGDGLPDVFVGCIDQPKRIGLSAGDGRMLDSGIELGASEMAGISAAGDLDGDGDTDLFIAVYGQGGANPVWLNQRIP